MSKMDYDDIEEDGECLSNIRTTQMRDTQSKHERLNQSKDGHGVVCDRFDSAYQSCPSGVIFTTSMQTSLTERGPCTSHVSLSVGNEGFDDVDGCFVQPAPVPSITGDFAKMHLDTEVNSADLYGSTDEGFVEHDVNKRLHAFDDALPQTQSCTSDHRVTVESLEVYQQDDDGDTQLHMAIIQLLSSLATYFINIAPNYDWLNLTNSLLQTPLHLAVITKQVDIVRRLIVGGADVDPRDHKGNTPLHIASKEGYEEIVNQLLDPVRYEETQQNNYEIPYQKIPQYLEAKNYEGQTCLHLAAEWTHLPVLQLLLSKGADINAQDGKSGRTILHYAAESGNRILLNFLLQHPRINVDAVTYGGLTAITLAHGRGFADVVNCLRNSGAKYEYQEELSDSSEEEGDDYDDICIGGRPVTNVVR